MTTLNDLQTISSETISEETLNTNFSLLNEVALTGTNLSLDLVDTSTDPNPLIKLDIINNNFQKIKDNWIDTSDATATVNDIAKDKTVYVNGEKIIGNIETIEAENEKDFGDSYTFYAKNSDNAIQLKLKPETDILFRAGSFPTIYPMASLFGDATTADVIAGKTFTSSAGLRQTGTASPEKAVANIIDFYSDMQNEHQHQIIIADKPITNIESIWLNRFYISQDDPNFSDTIPPSDYYDNGWSYEFHQIFYDQNANIKGIMTGGLNSDSGYYTTDSTTITNLTQPSPSIICLQLSDGAGIENYFPEDESNWEASGRWCGYVIGETSNNNTYYMKNIAGYQDNGFEWFSTNKYVQYNAGSRKWNICRLYFNFITESSITLNFQINEIEYGEYLIVGNLNSPLDDDRYIDNYYYFCSDKITSDYTKTITYTIPTGLNYIDIKVCSNSSTKIDAMTYFTVNI